jgi:glycosyltransferase involved in cell wall biosynthesis
MRLLKTPCVSVLMPCLNAADTLAAAIQSVLLQTFEDWELLVADDGSFDQSASIIRDFAARDGRVIFLDQQMGTSGAAAARNRALDQAKGRYIAFLDADDLWLPTKLEKQLAFMQTRHATFSHTSYLVRRSGRRDYVRAAPEVLTRKQLLRGNKIGCLTALYDTQVLGKQPMPEIVSRHDYALWLHLLTLTPRAVGLAEPLAIHQRSSGSLSANPWTSTRATFDMLQTQAGLSQGAALKATVRHVAGRLLHG